ncbi:hypothetical protein T492DRAFT_378378 [Pavlovales sp. CCMP2436]|nr:hypothetical protein T492DRAFT_378378 [Pavlovales sp. CCMP2436]
MKLAILAFMCVGTGAFELLAPARVSTSVRALAPRRARALPDRPAPAMVGGADAAAWQLAVSALIGVTVPLLAMASPSDSVSAELLANARAVAAQTAEAAVVETRAQLAQATKQLGTHEELVVKLRAHLDEMRAAESERAADEAAAAPSATPRWRRQRPRAPCSPGPRPTQRPGSPRRGRRPR